MNDKSRLIEGIIETNLIPGKLEEFITQMTPVLSDEVGTIYGDDKLTKLLKDVINEKDIASKLAKAKVLRDAIKVSSVLYSDNSEANFGEVNGENPKAEGLPNIVNKEDSISVAGDPVKASVNGNVNDLIKELTKATSALTTTVKELKNDAKATAAPANFASGPGIQVEAGPAVSSCPASVPTASEHVEVFAEDIKEGDIYNGRKVVAVTEEKSPVSDTTLYSFELDDRSVIKANAGTVVTFSTLDEIVNKAKQELSEENNMEDTLTFSEELAVLDFSNGVRTYSENFSNIMDYHDMDDAFDAESYVCAFSALEAEEESDPVYQLNSKLDQLSAKLDNFSAESEGEEEEEVEGDVEEFSEEELAYFSDACEMAEVFSELDEVMFDEETGMVVGQLDDTILVFCDEDETVYAVDEEAEGYIPVISYSDLLASDEEDFSGIGHASRQLASKRMSDEDKMAVYPRFTRKSESSMNRAIARDYETLGDMKKAKRFRREAELAKKGIFDN